MGVKEIEVRFVFSPGGEVVVSILLNDIVKMIRRSHLFVTTSDPSFSLISEVGGVSWMRLPRGTDRIDSEHLLHQRSLPKTL